MWQSIHDKQQTYDVFLASSVQRYGCVVHWSLYHLTYWSHSSCHRTLQTPRCYRTSNITDKLAEGAETDTHSPSRDHDYRCYRTSNITDKLAEGAETDTHSPSRDHDPFGIRDVTQWPFIIICACQVSWFKIQRIVFKISHWKGFFCDLDLCPPKFITSCPCPVYHLCQYA